jgi:hypothetical protein
VQGEWHHVDSPLYTSTQPIVVEGVLRVIRHPVRGEFRAVVELQVREARRVQ